MQTRPLDRERDTIRDELEELHVVRGKSVVNKRADVEYADDGIVGDQRHAEQCFNAFLEQDRIEHVLVVDMGEEDRSALRGDATGEAAADGDAHALLDLFFDSDGGPRDELVARFVEEQDGAGVDG